MKAKMKNNRMIQPLDNKGADTDNVEQRSVNRDDTEVERSVPRSYNLRSYRGRSYNPIFGDEQEMNVLQTVTTFSYKLLYCGNQENDEDKFGM